MRCRRRKGTPSKHLLSRRKGNYPSEWIISVAMLPLRVNSPRFGPRHRPLCPGRPLVGRIRLHPRHALVIVMSVFREEPYAVDRLRQRDQVVARVKGQQELPSGGPPGGVEDVQWGELPQSREGVGLRRSLELIALPGRSSSGLSLQPWTKEIGVCSGRSRASVRRGHFWVGFRRGPRQGR